MYFYINLCNLCSNFHLLRIQMMSSYFSFKPCGGNLGNATKNRPFRYLSNSWPSRLEMNIARLSRISRLLRLVVEGKGSKFIGNFKV